MTTRRTSPPIAGQTSTLAIGEAFGDLSAQSANIINNNNNGISSASNSSNSSNALQTGAPTMTVGQSPSHNSSNASHQQQPQQQLQQSQPSQHNSGSRDNLTSQGSSRPSRNGNGRGSAQASSSASATRHHHHHNSHSQSPTSRVAEPSPTATMATSAGPASPELRSWRDALLHKYVLLCLICGGMSILLGLVFAVVYIMLRNYTSSLHYFETIPTYIPACVLIINGIIVMCFAKRKYRYAYLIKLAGAFCLLCALLCVAITVTTTVVHMNRLQSLHECVYTTTTKSCMCVSSGSALTDLPPLLAAPLNGTSQFVFKDTPSCDVVHAGLYTCLRALFGLSVFGILVCIFASMLVYQLLSHEKKKIYFEQLESRRRFQHHQTFGRNRPVNGPHMGQHSALCNCIEDQLGYAGGWFPPPPPPWDMIDYQFPANGGYCRAGETDEARGWLNWPFAPQTQPSPVETNTGGFFSRLFRRNNSATQVPRAANPLHSWPQAGPMPPPHAFIPRMGMGNFSPATMQLSRQSRSAGRNANNRTMPVLNHRRNRSNDGIFHHLHHPGHYLAGAPLIAPPPSMFHMWGPPPPYSQPSAEHVMNSTLPHNAGSHHHHHHHGNNNNLALNGNANSGQHRRDPSIHSLTGGSAAERCSSKLSTPLSERRLLCNAFSSDGITLTIGNNPVGNGGVPSKGGNSCIVEVHQGHFDSPQHHGHHGQGDNSQVTVLAENNAVTKGAVPFNTLPNAKRNEHIVNHPFNPFNSMANIPLNYNLVTRNGSSQQIQVYHHQLVQNQNQSQAQPPQSKQQDKQHLLNNTQKLSNVRSTLYCPQNIPEESLLDEACPPQPFAMSSSSNSTDTSSSSTNLSSSSQFTQTLTSTSGSPTHAARSSSNVSSSDTNTSGTFSPTAGQHIVVENNSQTENFKATTVTHNTQSHPIETADDKPRAAARRGSRQNAAVDPNAVSKLIYAQSLPNLSHVTARHAAVHVPSPSTSSKNSPVRNSRQFYDMHRVPSSGNTSTSQDVADIELELDEQPVCYIPELPRDSTEVRFVPLNVFPEAINGQTVNCQESSQRSSTSKSSSTTPGGSPIRISDSVKPPSPFRSQGSTTTSSSDATSTLTSYNNNTRTATATNSGNFANHVDSEEERQENIRVTIRSIHV